MRDPLLYILGLVGITLGLLTSLLATINEKEARVTVTEGYRSYPLSVDAVGGTALKDYTQAPTPPPTPYPTTPSTPYPTRDPTPSPSSFPTAPTVTSSPTTATPTTQAPTMPPRPHIVFFLADDAGWNDFGFQQALNGYTYDTSKNQDGTGNKYKADMVPPGLSATPTLDTLASEGLILRQHYAQSVCSPSRASFLTGLYQSHHAVGESVIKPCHATGISTKFPWISEMLTNHSDYRSYFIGKGHIGTAQTSYMPANRGFHEHAGVSLGEADYFTHIRPIRPHVVTGNPSKTQQFDHAFNVYLEASAGDDYTSDTVHRVLADFPGYAESLSLEPEPHPFVNWNRTETHHVTLSARKLDEVLAKHAAGAEFDKRPSFVYFSSQLPHEGYDIKPGITKDAVDYLGSTAVVDNAVANGLMSWSVDELSMNSREHNTGLLSDAHANQFLGKNLANPALEFETPQDSQSLGNSKQNWVDSSEAEIGYHDGICYLENADSNGNNPCIRGSYVRMIRDLDAQVADLKATYEKHGLWDDTIFIFSSDNGALLSRRSGSNLPIEGTKKAMTDGGIRVPAFVRGTNVPSQSVDSTVTPGASSTHLMHISDWFSTILTIAGVSERPALLDSVDMHAKIFVDGGAGDDYAPRDRILHIANPDAFGGGGVIRYRDYKYMHVPDEYLQQHNSCFNGAHLNCPRNSGKCEDLHAGSYHNGCYHFPGDTNAEWDANADIISAGTNAYHSDCDVALALLEDYTANDPNIVKDLGWTQHPLYARGLGANYGSGDACCLGDECGARINTDCGEANCGTWDTVKYSLENVSVVDLSGHRGADVPANQYFKIGWADTIHAVDDWTIEPDLCNYLLPTPSYCNLPVPHGTDSYFDNDYSEKTSKNDCEAWGSGWLTMDDEDLCHSYAVHVSGAFEVLADDLGTNRPRGCFRATAGTDKIWYNPFSSGNGCENNYKCICYKAI